MSPTRENGWSLPSFFFLSLHFFPFNQRTSLATQKTLSASVSLNFFSLFSCVGSSQRTPITHREQELRF
jgi:hypothetical protein